MADKYLTLQDGRVVEALLPEGGGTGAPEFAVQNEEPTDESILLWYDPDAVGSGGGGSSYSPPTRQTATVTTSVLANGAHESQGPNLGSMWRLYRITVDRAARIRIYSSETKRTADLNRPVAQDPIGDHGILFEYVSVGSEGHSLVPVVDGWNETGGQTAYLTITNLSGSSAAVQLDCTYIRTE